MIRPRIVPAPIRIPACDDDEAQDIGTLRAERHANADLVCSLHDEERHHAVDADRSEDKRDPGEDRRGARPKARRGATESAITCFEGADVRDREGRIDRLHSCCAARSSGWWRPACCGRRG